MASNYPPEWGSHYGDHPSDPEPRQQVCRNGHGWLAQMFNELGGGFYVDEDEAYCPALDKDGVMACELPDFYNELSSHPDEPDPMTEFVGSTWPRQ